ncbi:alkylated DNA repair protein alkB homolog 8 [Galendromus occidentalis]|uniref:Alkylated DNA repair protein alkB homolog 8 n=1 Tax=Galendromus occidentalis TaxID=34638 RepID=A0AAJ6QNQ4_9ACAR|nr:alkylated DNA repair protein alkB homolog 8 [Galendromus occidentalis]
MSDHAKRSSKKRHKKLIKAGKSLENDFGVKLSAAPTKFVLLSNAGLVNGGLTSSILRALPESDNLHYDVVLHPDKTYAVVRCPNIEAASAVIENLDGSSSLDYLDGQPVHAGYLEGDIPDPDLQSSSLPSGLEIIENGLSPEDEAAWLKLCSFDDDSASCLLKNRLVEHFGYRFDYAINGVNRDDPLLEKPIPEPCTKFLKGLVHRGLMPESCFPNQLTVNRYEAGAGIPAHCDTHSMFSSCIVVVSLGADVVVNYRKDDTELSVLIPRRSVTLMQDESRYAWTHSIIPRKYDLIPSGSGAPLAVARGVRTSFTFRRVRSQEACDCSFPSLCDSRLKFSLDESDAAQLEKLHVHEVYENIASHFSDTRHSQWPKVVEFLNSLPDCSLVVDVGCGNGKNMLIKNREDLSFIGCDRSSGLLEICRRKNLQALQCDCLALPFRHAVFDAVICIAVIHHLSTSLRRRQAIEQLLSLLKKDGKLLISVWAFDQNLRGGSKYLKGGDPSTATARHACIRAGKAEVTLPVHTNRCAFSNSDVLVPWKKSENNDTQQRYYHVFDKGELRSLVQDIEGIELLDEYHDEGNWCIILKKTQQVLNEVET